MREWFKKHILDYLRTSVLRLRNGMADGVELWKWGDALQGRGSDCQGTSKDMGGFVHFHSHESTSKRGKEGGKEEKGEEIAVLKSSVTNVT